MSTGAPAAAASAGDEDGRAGRRRDAEAVPAALLAVARARSRTGRDRGRGDVRPRLVGPGLRPHRRLTADHGVVRRRRADRVRGRLGSPLRRDCARGRLPDLPAGAVPLQRLRPARGGVARAARAGGAGRPDRTARVPRVVQARICAREGGLRPCDRVARDARDRLVPHRDGAVHPPARRQQGRPIVGGLRGAARDLADPLPRRWTPLLRPGGPVRVGPPAIKEEPRCRPTSC
jgi:hypothetical protein